MLYFIHSLTLLVTFALNESDFVVVVVIVFVFFIYFETGFHISQAGSKFYITEDAPDLLILPSTFKS